MTPDNLHSILDRLSWTVNVSSIRNITKLIIKYRSTSVFRVTPEENFMHGIISETGNLTARSFNQNDECYTFGLNILSNITLAVIFIVGEGVTIMSRADCKVLFNYNEEEKISNSISKQILKKIKETQ